MARRSDHSRDELADLVIQAAHDLVAKGGRRAVTARAIASAIGYAAGSIYNAVGDLDLVVLRVNAATLTALADELEKVASQPRLADKPLETVLAVAKAYMRFVTEHHRLWATVLEPVLNNGPVPPWYAAARARLSRLVNKLLESFFSDPAERYRAAIALWASLQGVAALAVSGNLELDAGQLDPTEIADSIVRRYLAVPVGTRT